MDEFTTEELAIVWRWLKDKANELNQLVELQAEEQEVTMADFCQTMMTNDSISRWANEIFAVLEAAGYEVIQDG